VRHLVAYLPLGKTPSTSLPRYDTWTHKLLHVRGARRMGCPCMRLFGKILSLERLLEPTIFPETSTILVKSFRLAGTLTTDYLTTIQACELLVNSSGTYHYLQRLSDILSPGCRQNASLKSLRHFRRALIIGDHKISATNTSIYSIPGDIPHIPRRLVAFQLLS